MANYAGKDLTITFNGQAITANVRDPLTVSRESVIEDITPFGQQDQVFGYAGLRKGKAITVGGLYDDTPTTGTDAIFIAIGTSASLVIAYGGTKQSTVTAFVQSYDRVADPKGKFTRYKAVLQPSGAWTEV